MSSRLAFLARTMLVALASGLMAACGGGSDFDAADSVFTNGFVYTMDEANPEAEAVAVRGSGNCLPFGDNP